MIVIQIVNVVWTKATRGAPRANERAALPRAFPIARDDAPYYVQCHCLDEAKGFRSDSHEVHRGDKVRRTEGPLLLRMTDRNTLQVGLSSSGQPPRKPVPRVFELEPGEYARLATNGRHASYSGQWYTETICHVAFGDEVPVDRFVASVPDRTYSQMEDLF